MRFAFVDHHRLRDYRLSSHDLMRMVNWALLGRSRGREAVFEQGLSDWPELGLTRFSAGRGLRELESAGLVGVRARAGRKPIVKVPDGRREAVGGAGPRAAPRPSWWPWWRSAGRRAVAP